MSVVDESGREAVLSALGEHIDTMRADFGVADLAIFGSVARGECSATSDINGTAPSITPITKQRSDTRTR